MRGRALAASLVGVAVLAGCGKSGQQSNNAAASPAATQAAADASNVTAIPGYTPETGNAPPGNAAGNSAP